MKLDIDNANLRYCLQFLKNGGERLAAIRLCSDATGMGLIKAKNFVDNLHEPKRLVEKPEFQKYCPSCLNYLDPKTPDCPICGNKELVNSKYINYV